MTNASSALLQFLRASITGRPVESDVISLSSQDWSEVVNLSFEQGVAALAADGYCKWLSENGTLAVKCLLESDESLEDIKFEWLGTVIHAETGYAEQWNAACKMADMFAFEGIRTRVMKGFSIAALYPVPSHREFCDCDVFLGDGYELGNRLMERSGVNVNRSYYKNSVYVFNDLSVENHRFCSPVRGFGYRKKYERYLRSIIDDGSAILDDSHLWSPGPLFTALFVTSHALMHFLLEGGINLRHVCDFALAVKDAENRGLLAEYKLRCREFGLWKFACAMGPLASKVFGVELPLEPSDLSSSDRLLEEIFTCNHQGDSCHIEKKRDINVRVKMVRDMFRGRWKFHLYSDHGVLFTLSESILGFFFERKVRDVGQMKDVISPLTLLLRIYAGVTDSLESPFSNDQWERIVETVGPHRLHGILNKIIGNLPKEFLPSRHHKILMAYYGELIAKCNQDMNNKCALISDVFANMGLPNCILKGQGIAMLYPSPEARSSGDIDLWVKGSTNSVLTVLKSRWKLNGVFYHHTSVFPFDDNTEVEVHFHPSWMNNPFANRRLQNYFKSKEDRQFGSPKNELGFRTPDIELACVQEITHICHHLLMEGVGIRQIMDLYFIIVHSTPEDRENVRKLIASLRIVRFTGALMWVLNKWFLLDSELFVAPADAVLGTFLENEILMSGNFGCADCRNTYSPSAPLFTRFHLRMTRIVRFMNMVPSEVIWAPAFKTWQLLWRKKFR